MPQIIAASASTWHQDAVTLLHCDNHSTQLGDDHSVDEISQWLKEIPVSAVQVSAYGAMGDRVTYNSEALPYLNYPDSKSRDTLALWREATLKAGKRFNVYINTRGFKIYQLHPDWMQCNFEGKGHGRGKDLLDACARPSLNNDGYLECVLLPMLREITQRYQPSAFWVDGDHARTQTCYCKNCKFAWKKLSGKTEPPITPADSDWPRWLELQQRRYDEYRIAMAQSVHNIDKNTLYASNHSWHTIVGNFWTSQDPRSAPDGIDYYTADLSHGQSLKQSRVYAMSLSAEEDLPCEIMHSIFSPKISLSRIIQQGCVTLSSGAAWNLWLSGTTVTMPEARERAKFCAVFADIRSQALGKTTSLNQTAVLISETSWAEQRIAGVEHAYKPDIVKNVALALQDSGYTVDIINETILGQRLNNYRTLVIPSQHKINERSMQLIKLFVKNGGALIYCNSQQCDTLSGAHIYRCALDGIPYPDTEGLMARYMQAHGHEPEVRIKSATGDFPHLIYAFRKKNNQTILHVNDITSYVNHKRVLPDSRDTIDPVFHTRTIQLELALPEKPLAVIAACNDAHEYQWSSRVKEIKRIFPGSQKVSLPRYSLTHNWESGILQLTISNFTAHAAIIIDNQGCAPLPLPKNSSPKEHLAYLHYRDLKTVASDFESEINGHYFDPLLIFSIPERYAKLITLTEENPADGNSSLLFKNNPEIAPYLYIHTQPIGYKNGTALLSLDLKVSANASATIEFREKPNRKTHPVGPSIKIKDGKIYADDRSALRAIENDKWYKIEIICPLHETASTYSLELTTPDGIREHFKNLAFVSGQTFNSCGWLGIVSSGAKETSIALDNFELRLVKAEPEKAQE